MLSATRVSNGYTGNGYSDGYLGTHSDQYYRGLDEGVGCCCWNAGTSLYYEPGMLQGGSVEHSCNVHRSIGYYLEVLLCLAPFCKQKLQATLTGVTSNPSDPSVSFHYAFSS